MPRPKVKQRQLLGLNEAYIVKSSWRLMLIFFLVGGLIGAAVYTVFPPQYRARSVITIDQNLEKIFPESPDREIFYFLERETNKLEELAWSDQVLQKTVDIAGVGTIKQLRNSILQLSQPGDGGWKLYATSPDPKTAKLIANAWADAFEETVRLGASVERERAALQILLEKENITPGQINQAEITRIISRLNELDKLSLGIDPQLEVTRSQKSDIQVVRKASQGLYILGGAMVGLICSLMAVILFPSRRDEKTI